MKYQDLTEEQKEFLAKTTLILRQTAGEFARLANKLEFQTRGIGYEYMVGLVNALHNYDAEIQVPAVLDESGNEVTPATTEIAGPQLVPNPDITGELRGATSLSKEAILKLIQLSNDLKTLNTDSIKTACVEAVGPFRVTG